MLTSGLKNGSPMTADSDAEMVLEVQYASEAQALPEQADILGWAQAALAGDAKRRELLVRIVDEEESRALNERYRGRDKPTNVLSFPFESPPGVQLDHLGDLVICAPVVMHEAQLQGKPLMHHWAHMVVHGVLHLRGYDHLSDAQAEEMEALEKHILRGLGMPDPYVMEDRAVQ